LGIILAFGYYSHVRAQEGNRPGGIVLPLRPVGPLSRVAVPQVFGIEGIVADKAAAIQLGKALFWDMQAGSDDIQACASCHFNAGADSRPANTLNPGQAGGDNSFQMGLPVGNSIGPNYVMNPGTPGAGFGGYHDGDFPFHKLSDPNNRGSVIADVNDVAGSQGVFATSFVSVGVPAAPAPPNPTSSGIAEIIGNSGDEGGTGDDAGFTRGGDGTAGTGRGLPRGGPGIVTVRQGGQTTVSLNAVETSVSTPDPVFSYPDPVSPAHVINTRKVTGRNTPSVVDAVFNYRNFWDGRAQNVCNGANPFGARDKSSHLVVVNATDGKLSNAFVAMQNSALCSQALGPILSSVEMSSDGRDFRHVGRKLLARQPLAKQMVDPADSVLGLVSNSPQPGISATYRAMIQQAFLPEWWQFTSDICIGADGTIKATVDPKKASCPANTEQFNEMEYNFSLFWGVAIQAYESTLIADQTPLDKFLEQQQTYTVIGDSQKQQYTIQLPPNVDPFTLSVIELNPNHDFSDSDVYAFDNGYGAVQGEGITQATIDYATGKLDVFFDLPPKAAFPIRINYSVGPLPLTRSQLNGFLIFQTKGRCVVCHGGPEFSNAVVDTVAPNPMERMVMGDLGVRVYDTGYYHIGVRIGAEDAGLAGADPVGNLPLSQSELMRQRVCQDSSMSVMIPGRPGDGITQAPLSCTDDIARTGFFKAPQLRNVALTAPYFHNGSQLTLEQVVEFYNRGGDFNQGSELSLMDTDIVRLGLTLQEKQDLVDFLRTALTDQRTVTQAAPFDHPELLLPNGHATAGSYPVQNDPDHPGQAKDSYMHVPAVGKNGGKPFSTFLENLVTLKNGGSL
jgi:cytochrome c peroxidase